MHAELQLDNQICFRLYTAARLVTQAYTPMLTELGITYPQYLVLMVLWEKDNQPVNDIAHRLLLETNTVTPLLQRMEKLGIVSRKKGEQDKRQQIVSLTEKGKQLEDAQSCPTLCDPMNRSTPGLAVHHHLPEFTQTHIHRVGDTDRKSVV